MKERPFIANSGLLVNTRPEKLGQVQAEISALKNAEVSFIVDRSRLAIIIHAGSMEEKKNLLKAIENIDGVLSVNLTYDHFQDSEMEGQ